MQANPTGDVDPRIEPVGWEILVPAGKNDGIHRATRKGRQLGGETKKGTHCPDNSKHICITRSIPGLPPPLPSPLLEKKGRKEG